MRALIKSAIVTILIMVMMALTTFAQGQVHKQVHFSINVPKVVRMGEYILPPGNYVLRQVLQNDLNLFALSAQDWTNEPLAIIRTTRIDYQATGYPEKTRLLLIDEEDPGLGNYPVVVGWTIPGMDGWEIIGVVESGKDH